MTFLSLLPILVACGGPEPTDDFEVAIRERFDASTIPALQVSVFTPSAVLFAGAYGYADLDEGRENTLDTPFLVASISKAFTAVTLLQVWETGVFELDDDINDALDFPVVNPSFPESPITYRQLLSHTSSLGDPPDEEYLYFWDGVSTISLYDYLRSVYDPAGERYNPDWFYLPVEPGSAFFYSNHAYALAGLMAQAVSGEDFAALGEAHIFEPLGMNAGWLPSDFPSSGEGAPAMPYTFDEDGHPVALGHYGVPDYPDGTLCTDVVSLSHFVMALLNGGTLNGATILQPDTVTLMLTPEAYAGTGSGVPEDYGLGISFFHAEGEEIIGHSGGDVGVATMWEYYPEAGFGIAMLNNGFPDEDGVDLALIREALVAYGRGAAAR